MIIELNPPLSAGPLHLDMTGDEVIAVMRQFGEPEVLCRAAGERPEWGVSDSNGLFLRADFGPDDRVSAVEIGRPTEPVVTVTYDGLDIFQTAASELVEALSRKTWTVEKENGHSFIAPDLLLALWRPTIPEGLDDADGKYFESVLMARPGYYEQA
ncbi:hypothetical protein [Kribbella sp. NPDC051770]|uniref:hypothetical protein n=1 Tax=Kribbella sp. NPDC051770 TaxID=3155413 RepID=UPI00341BB23D